MKVELNEKEISLLKRVYEASTAQETEFKVGDKVRLRRYTTYGTYSKFYEVKEVGFEGRLKSVTYTLEGLNLDEETVYEPSIGLSYGAGIGASYQTVSQKVLLKGFKGGNGRVTKMRKNGNSSYVYELNKSTGRYREIEHSKLSLVTEADIGSVIESYEIDDPNTVDKIFADHPEWKKEETRKYNMSRN